MFDKYMPFTTTYKEILNQVEDQNLLKRLNLMRSDLRKRDNTKYYRFDRDYRYDTEECFEMKEDIKNLICRGWLRQFVTCLDRHQGWQSDRQPP